MSDTQIGTIFYSVALPMCMLILAYLYWSSIRRRDRAKDRSAPDPRAGVGLRQPSGLANDHNTLAA